MSTQASEDPPRVVRTARILGYVSAALFAIDIAWVLLAHMGTTVSDAQYSVGMMLLSALSVVAAIFAFLVQSDYRRGRREDRRHAEIVARQDQRHAEIMALLESKDAGQLGQLAAQLQQADYGQRETLTQVLAWVLRLSEKVDKLIHAERQAREQLDEELHSITGDLTDRVEAIAAGGYEHVDPASNVRTFVPAETMDALKYLGGGRPLPHPPSPR